MIEPRHLAIDGELEDWGRWSRERAKRLKCGSAEGNFRPRNGNIDMGWEHNAPEPTPVQLPNLRMQEIDRAVLRVPELHRKALALYYVQRKGSQYICHEMKLRRESFGAFLTVGRDMVLNLLRRNAK
jgi:DNA-directed RNA polymerase specialized sigma24 family protein